MTLETPEDVKQLVEAAVEKLKGARPVGTAEHCEAVRELRRLLSNCERGAGGEGLAWGLELAGPVGGCAGQRGGPATRLQTRIRPWDKPWQRAPVQHTLPPPHVCTCTIAHYSSPYCHC